MSSAHPCGYRADGPTTKARAFLRRSTRHLTRPFLDMKTRYNYAFKKATEIRAPALLTDPQHGKTQSDFVVAHVFWSWPVLLRTLRAARGCACHSTHDIDHVPACCGHSTFNQTIASLLLLRARYMWQVMANRTLPGKWRTTNS